MLPKAKRLTKKDFSQILEKSLFLHSKNLLLRYRKTKGISRFSASVPKKVAKTAVERNRARRRMYSAIIFKDGLEGVFFAKNNLKNISFKELSEEVALLISKASLQ